MFLRLEHLRLVKSIICSNYSEVEQNNPVRCLLIVCLFHIYWFKLLVLVGKENASLKQCIGMYKNNIKK